ncbi:MAG TPA: hypothetical protein VGA61_13720 [Anaerolineae bacterium]
MKRKTVLIVVGALLALCLIGAGVAVALGLGLTQPATDVGNKFMQSVKSADYSSAYALMTPALQHKVGNVSGLQKMIERKKAQPTNWTFTDRQVNGDVGQLRGTATFASGSGQVLIDLEKSENAWKITGFNLSPQ